MSFRISGLPAAAFAPLHALADAELAARGMERVIADRKPGAPCRVSLEDAEPGERLLLLNWEHQPAATPYRSSHAIYVREGATEARPAVGEVPEALRIRPLSVRSFDAAGRMLDADLVDGAAVESLMERLLLDPAADYLHLHYARRGCYAARADRVGSMSPRPDVRD
jgi:hypothetical protein